MSLFALLNKSAVGIQQRSNRSSARFRPVIESLEARELMAGDVLQLGAISDAATDQTENIRVADTTNADGSSGAIRVDYGGEAALANSLKPGTAILYGPSGSTGDATPTFRWSTASNATWYYLYVRNDNTGQVLSKWVQGATSYTHEAGFTEGNYRFWVRTWGNGIYGDWSAPQSFDIATSKPGTATLYGPGGSTNDTTPTFRWSTAANATWYYLYVRNDDTGQVVTKWVQGATSYTHNSALSTGNYRFWVRAWANGNHGDWSAPKQFKIEMMGKPETALLYGPNGSTGDTTPTFRWSSASNATWYYLYVRNENTGQVVTKWVQGATSYTHDAGFAEGNYRFWVRTWGNGIYGDWSAPNSFSISTVKLAKPVLELDHYTDVYYQGARFSWTNVSGASGYELWVNVMDGSAQKALHRTDVTGTSFTVRGSDLPKAGGTKYRIWVRALGTDGQTSAWSNYVDFQLGIIE